MTQSVEYDVATLIDGSVPSIEAKLHELTDNQLVELAGLENAGKTRSTLLAAIAAEQKGRAEAAALKAGAELPSESGDEKPPVEPGPDAGDSPDSTFADAPHPDPAVNDLAAPREKFVALRNALIDAGFVVSDDYGADVILVAAQAIRDLGSMLTEAQQAGRLPQSEGDIVPPEGALAPLELSADADGETALIVMFEGIGGRPIPALGKLTFAPTDFVQDTGGKSRVLARPIVFPLDVAPTQVAAVWLLDEDGEPWSRCPIIGQFNVGGGRQSSIPANFLRFDAPAQVKAAA